jgi:polysaccharide biosynthesis/export protein
MRVIMRIQNTICLSAILVIMAGAPGPIAAEDSKPAKETSKQQPGQADTAADPEYRVGPGDVLDIAVWKEPDASGAGMIVRPDGKISLPLVNELVVKDRTPIEIQQMLAEKLEPFIKSAAVTVTVREIRSKKVYIIGQIERPGTYDLTRPTSVLQMLTQAGRLLPFAKDKAIYVLRTQGESQQKLPFNYRDVLKGRKMDQNVMLQPGDTIIIP